MELETDSRRRGRQCGGGLEGGVKRGGAKRVRKGRGQYTQAQPCQEEEDKPGRRGKGRGERDK